ncbi:MAG: SDR family NAD(P)-dependent oxidoreductase [Pikeienuella sp.]|uniref:SDR family NAD(P)-dependent oxidoreductase n=1 Tax=Pikeienuella sp. TaxID=2831957 RepID=UPI00391CADF8
MTGMFDLTGKVALVTGSSRGIGRAMAEGLAMEGARVVISSRKADACEKTAADINAMVGAERAFAIPGNAGRREEVEALVSATQAKLGPIDILVGNAAVNPHFGSMDSLTDEAFDKIMSTNVRSNLHLAKLCAPDMIAKGEGSMIFTSSIGAFKPSLEIGAYNISKLALLGLVRNLAAEYGPKGIRANAVCPGLIRTEFARALYENPEREAAAVRAIPLGRLGEPEDFRGVAAFLASGASRYMTGQAVTLCGGSNMWA